MATTITNRVPEADELCGVREGGVEEVNKDVWLLILSAIIWIQIYEKVWLQK